MVCGSDTQNEKEQSCTKTILFLKKDSFIYLRERQRESACRGRGRGREKLKQTLLSIEPHVGLDLITQRSDLT